MSGNRILSPEEVTPDSPEEAAPHLASSEAGDEWHPVGDIPLEAPVRPSKPEDKWPGEWHIIAWALASGSAQRTVARELGYTEAWVSTVANRPEIVARIEQIRNEHWSLNIEKRFSNMAPKAAAFMADVIEGKGAGRDAKISERLDASKWTLEKVTGKAKPAGEADTGLTIVNVFNTLDQLKKTGQLDSATKQEREVFEALTGSSKETNWMDDFVAKQDEAKREEKK